MPRRGLEEAQYATRRTVPIRPILGHWSYDPPRDVPDGSSPDMQNCVVERGVLCKRMGYAPFPSLAAQSVFDTPVIGLFSTQDIEGNHYLYALTMRKMFVYNETSGTWDQIFGPAFTGDIDDVWVWETTQDSVVFTNGVDPVMRVIVGELTYAPLNLAAPSALYMARFNGRLNLGVTREEVPASPGTFIVNPYRHRWCARDLPTDWVSIGSGFRDQNESHAHMKGMKKLGSQLILYYDQGIEACITQPSAEAPHRYEIRVADIGLYAPHTLDGRNDQHLFLGWDDFYAFNGATPVSIGQQVRDEVFRFLTASRLDTMFGKILPATQEYAAFLSFGGFDYPNCVWVYSWARNIWYKWAIDNIHRCAVIHRLADPLTIDELVGTIDEQNWAFDSIVAQEQYPALFTGTNENSVMRWSPLVKNDNTDLITCRWTSQDFTAERIFQAPGQKLTLERLTIEYMGTGNVFFLDFYFSIDGGETWSEKVQVFSEAFATGLHTMFVTRRVTGDKIRFKFEQTSGTLNFFITKFEPEFTLHETPEYEA